MLRRRRARQEKQRDDMDHLAGVPEPYRLRVVAHSLGGAALLVYAVQCRRMRRPHHIYRLILLTPAGFLEKIPLVRSLLSCCSRWPLPESTSLMSVPSSLAYTT